LLPQHNRGIHSQIMPHILAVCHELGRSYGGFEG
jgi:hypothetical protein